MNERKIIRTDFWVQAILFACIVVPFLIWLLAGKSETNFLQCIVSFLVLLAWQFFSGIQMAAELGRWYRGISSACLLIGLVLGIVLLSMDLPTGGWITFYLMPITVATNLIIGVIDFQKYERTQLREKIGNEHILDSGDLFP